MDAQKRLNTEQVAAFYHTCFVEQQVAHFKQFMAKEAMARDRVVVDVSGYFARAIKEELNIPVRVIDSDPLSVCESQTVGVEAICDDALSLKQKGDEGVVCFNLILHYLVGDSEASTRALQSRALMVWRETGVKIFVNEYIYESWFGNLSGWLIYQITKSRILSALGKHVSAIVPSLRANTFGVGVRFRSCDEWRTFFLRTGFRMIAEVRGDEETVSLPRRFLLIKGIRRDSFLLESV